ncbi:MAG: nucleotidyltransferase domain-containing protein [Thiotrichaceae bacterium]|nr:nucleotidyltransferase domain-containing protein [Thiotrichaceae bacterium]
MRLNHFEIKSIITETKNHFGEHARVYLFGSRVDDNKKGGDIDLYITAHKNEDLYQQKLQFLIKLQQKIGEQKIDLILAKDPSRLIEQTAKQEGIELTLLDLRIQKVINECDKHLLRMNDAYQDMQAFMLLNPERYQQLSKDEVQDIDQYLYRFSKLQDAMGEKLFKLIISQYDDNSEKLPFIDILNKLEKLEIINSADDWKILRQIRNDLAHEYDDDPDKTSNLLNTIYAKNPLIEAIYLKLKQHRT